MPDVLFDSGQYTLKSAARERLARISGIVLAYPELRLEVEGHTDSIGGDEFNQRLSEKRANSVRDYLVDSGISMDGIIARGFGKTQPVADNATSEGRKLNRRVEMIVSGDVIGNMMELRRRIRVHLWLRLHLQFLIHSVRCPIFVTQTGKSDLVFPGFLSLVVS